MSKPRRDYEWALEMARQKYPDHEWKLHVHDYGFSVGLAGDGPLGRGAVLLCSCGFTETDDDGAITREVAPYFIPDNDDGRKTVSDTLEAFFK